MQKRLETDHANCSWTLAPLAGLALSTRSVAAASSSQARFRSRHLRVYSRCLARRSSVGVLQTGSPCDALCSRQHRMTSRWRSRTAGWRGASSPRPWMAPPTP